MVWLLASGLDLATGRVSLRARVGLLSETFRNSRSTAKLEETQVTRLSLLAVLSIFKILLAVSQSRLLI